MAVGSQVNLDQEFHVPEEECRQLLARILNSPEFQRANRLRAFLTYVVERKIDGRPEEVTETLIGHRVFERPATYNPGDDSIVRTEARTLRQRLERYFSTTGASEQVILEIPRGAYLPVFRRRPQMEPVATTPANTSADPRGTRLSRRQLLVGGAAAAGLAGATFWILRKSPAANANDTPLAVRQATMLLESSDRNLNDAFRRAKERALACVFTRDPVGDWYASNRDNRAFCMRDTTHESTGAALLGLYRQSHNMLHRFAASIARSRNWCGYWIITKDGFPSPLEYTNDENFNYVLPANFDVLLACYRQLLWTGNSQYLDPVFTGFYDCTVSSYVAAWDMEKDGIMKARPDRPRVAGSYNQQPPRFRTGADLVGAEYAGYLAYAAIQEIKGGPGSLSDRMAKEYRGKAEALRKRFNTEWWDAEQNRFRSGIMPDGSWSNEFVAPCHVYPLRFGIAEDGARTEASLDLMEHKRPPFDSTYSHYPEVFYRYGRNEAAYRYLLEICDPGFSGYAMAEMAFVAIGNMGAGLMGIAPDAPKLTVETLPRLPKAMEWVRVANVPVASNQIAVEHRGVGETRFTNQSGETLLWRAAFPVPASGSSAGILLDASPAGKLGFERRPNGQGVIFASVPVKAGQSRVARLVV